MDDIALPYGVVEVGDARGLEWSRDHRLGWMLIRSRWVPDMVNPHFQWENGRFWGFVVVSWDLMENHHVIVGKRTMSIAHVQELC